jgi:hypothetical protein
MVHLLMKFSLARVFGAIMTNRPGCEIMKVTFPWINHFIS